MTLKSFVKCINAFAERKAVQLKEAAQDVTKQSMKSLSLSFSLSGSS